MQNKIEELERLTQTLEKVLYDQKIPENDTFNIVLVMEELFVNQVSYGYSDSTSHIIDIDIDWNKDEKVITLTIKNDGTEFNLLNKKDPDTHLGIEDRPIGGLGIFFVKQKMDFVSYKRENDQNIIVLKKNIKNIK
ncbi:MAG: ATP-binding protein [Bacteroidales bacterium]|nr:ATP-binding protein [Bacteroidales bacterium]